MAARAVLGVICLLVVLSSLTGKVDVSSSYVPQRAGFSSLSRRIGCRPIAWKGRLRLLVRSEKEEPSMTKEEEEIMYGKKDGAMGQGMVEVDKYFLDAKKDVSDDDLMRSGQLGEFTAEFMAEFKYPIGATVWYKSLTHFDQWIKAEVEGYSGQDLDGIRYYMLDIEQSAIPNDPCTRRENVAEEKLRSLEEGIPEGEEEYKGGATMYIHPDVKPPPPRQFRAQPLRIKKDTGQPKTMLWKNGPDRMDQSLLFEYEEDPGFGYNLEYVEGSDDRDEDENREQEEPVKAEAQ